MRFTNAYAACPVCSPTRASIMTGHIRPGCNSPTGSPAASGGHGETADAQFRQGADEITLAEALKPAGYVSANIGK